MNTIESHAFANKYDECLVCGLPASSGAHTHEIKYLGDVQRLALQPGDIIVISTHERLSMYARERIKYQLEELVGKGNRVIVLDNDNKIGIVSPE